MKLKIRPLQQGKGVFEVDIEPSESIYALKLRISEHGFPIEAQNLLNTGKSLQDDKTISSCSIKESSTLVLMIKAGVTPSASMSNSPRMAPGTLNPPPTVPGPASANHLTVPTPAYATPAIVPPVAAASSPKPISEVPPGPALNGTGIYSNAAPSQSNIERITGMGFSHDQAVRALRTSHDNVDQAIELLVGDTDNLGTGSASGNEQAPNILRNMSRLTNGTAPNGAAPNGTAPLTNGLPQSLVPQNLMKMVAQQQQQQELPDLSSMSMSALGGGLGGGSSSSGGATAEVTPEQIEQIRRMVAFNPILIEPLLEQFRQEDPDLYNRIGGDPEKLLTIFSELGDGSGPSASSAPASLLPPALPPAPARLPATAPVPAPFPQGAPQPRTESRTISVTREESEQIENIVTMGFERQTVLQAFMACDRNAERAVEFLLAGAFE